MTSKGKIILNKHSFRLEESYYGQVLCVLGEARCESQCLVEMAVVTSGGSSPEAIKAKLTP